jgi:hypothetical protein
MIRRPSKSKPSALATKRYGASRMGCSLAFNVVGLIAGCGDEPMVGPIGSSGSSGSPGSSTTEAADSSSTTASSSGRSTSSASTTDALETMASTGATTSSDAASSGGTENTTDEVTTTSGTGTTGGGSGMPMPCAETVFGTAMDEWATAAAIHNGSLFISGSRATLNHEGVLARFDLPLSDGVGPTWDFEWPGLPGDDLFHDLEVDATGVYVVGRSFSQTTDLVGGKEWKGVALRFPLDGATGPAVGGADWVVQTPAAPGAFPYGGYEALEGLALDVGTGQLYATGWSQSGFSNGGRTYVSHVEPNGTVDWTYMESAIVSFAAGWAVAAAGGDVYVAGVAEDPAATVAALWRLDTNGQEQWQEGVTSGELHGIVMVDGDVVAAGWQSGGVGGSDDFLVERWDAIGTLVWSQPHDLGGSLDRLHAIELAGEYLYAVGETTGGVGGGTDVVVLQLDPSTGTVLTETFWGGAATDLATAVVTDGIDLLVVGETASEGSGGRDVVVLCFTPD